MDIDTNQQSRREALEFLAQNHTMVIATVSEDGEPQAATVYFAVDENLYLYFATPIGSRKHKNLKSNGRVGFVIGTGPEVKTIQGGGIATEFPIDEQKAMLGKIMETATATPDKWPYFAFAKKGYAIFRIKPSWMVWLDFHRENFKNDTPDNFLKII